MSNRDFKRLQASRPCTIAVRSLLMAATLLLAAGCTQETQNQLQRGIQNWTGTNGVLEIYAGDKLVRRFMKIDKMSTAMGTDDRSPRPYRYGYGVLDENLNAVVDAGAKRVFFESPR